MDGMNHRPTWGIGLAAVAVLALAGCSSSAATPSPEATTTPTAGASAATAAPTPTPAPVSLTMAGWSLSQTPEFQTLADAFHAANPWVTIKVIEYKAGNDYDTQMIADLAAGSAPDLYILKNLKNFYTYEDGGQLMDVSDVASGLDSHTSGLSFYQVDGKTFAVPYRQDSWYLFYDKDMFDQAGVAYPDGKWTWDDYAAAADKIQKAIGGGDVYAAYEHGWQSTVQGFANAQAPGASILSGNFDYMKAFYDRALKMQDSGDQPSYNTLSTNKLTYQAQWGKQKAAMLIMGSWNISSYLANVKNGDAVDFKWGIAPVPQVDSSTFSDPVTFGDPTAIGINPAIDASKVDAAKQFLAFVGGQDAAVALAKLGLVPAYSSDAVTAAFVGLPTDDLSKFTFGTHKTMPENPVSANTAKVQSILGDMHTAIMSESSSVGDAIAAAEARFKSEVGS
jgi:multiple sugar transport system substrate-binding protein